MPVYARWKAVVAFDDTETGDGRWFGSFTWRPGVHALKQFHPSAFGDEPVIIGHVDSYEKIGGVVFGFGVYYDTAEGRDCAAMAVSGSLSGVSAEPGGLGEVEYWEWTEDGPDSPADGIFIRFHQYEIGALAVVPIAGFEGAGIFEVVLADDDDDLEVDAESGLTAIVASSASLHVLDEYEDDDADFGFGGLVASSSLPEYPAAAFTLPESPVPMPLTVFDDLSFAGHLAVHGTCHVAFADRCVRPPTSKLAYAPARQSTIRLDNGLVVRAARISIGSNHAASNLNPRASADFYERESNCAGVADVMDGDVGIWVRGHVYHDADAETLRRFAQAAWSGDWRSVRRNLELIGILSVNFPGFPIPDPKMWIAGKEQRSLVASGAREVASLDRSQPLAWAREVHGLRPMPDREAEAKAKLVDRVAASLGLPTSSEDWDRRMAEAAALAGIS